MCGARCSQVISGEHISDGWETVICLVGGDMMDVRGRRKHRVLVCNMAGVEGMTRLTQTREGLIQRRRLNHALIRESGVVWCVDGETWRWTFPSISAGTLGGTEGGILAGGCFAIAFLGALATFLSGFDDLSLLLTYIETALQLLAHSRVLSLKSRREAGNP